ncbi:MAG: hypothetical protein JSV23_02170, partial [Promethearchaeota archaeon]
MEEHDDEDFVYCQNCEVEIPQDEAIYVSGKPYCETCYQAADEYGIYDEYNDDDEENDDDEDDDDEDD